MFLLTAMPICIHYINIEREKKTTFNLAKLRCVDIIELFYDNFSLSFKDIHEYVDM